MMSDTVWISTAIGHASNLRPMTHSFSGDDNSIRHASECRRLNEEGKTLGSECFPTEVFGAPNVIKADYSLPHLFFAGSFWVVSALAANVMKQFNLGDGSLYPVNVLENDRQTSIGNGWFCINLENIKHGIVPNKSPRMMQDYISKGVKGWFPPFKTVDGDIAVSAAVLGPPDLWIDPSVGRSFFLSGALGVALKKARADKGFFLSKCRLVIG